MRSVADHRRHLCKLINRISTAMMVSETAQGTMHARPMATAEVDEEFTSLYFGSRRDSSKIDELQRNPRVCLTYTNSAGTEWVSVSGVASIVDNPRLKHELWTVGWKNYFQGPDDPALVLIRVDPELAEYWDADNMVVAMAKFAASAATGRHFDMGRDEKVNLRHEES